MVLSVVLLPAPLAPMSVTISPPRSPGTRPSKRGCSRSTRGCRGRPGGPRPRLPAAATSLPTTHSSRDRPRSPSGCSAPPPACPRRSSRRGRAPRSGREMPMTTLMSCSIRRMVMPVVPDPPDQLHELVGLLRVHARRGLVQEEQFGLGGQRARDLQPALRRRTAGSWPARRPGPRRPTYSSSPQALVPHLPLLAHGPARAAGSP